ncbi:MAG: protease modulator HflC [Armatimonadetes bacterium]|nr:protease modulator HflC [Armatimonadota bacterium]
MSRTGWARTLGAIVACLAVYRTFYVVDETQSAVVTRFGRVVREVETPGLRVKWPVDSAWRLDKRLQIYDPGPAQLLTRDKKMLQVDPYVCWRIMDPERYVRTVADPAMARRRIYDLVRSQVAAELGKVDLAQIVSTNEKDLQLEAVLKTVTLACRAGARDIYGIDIADVGIKRLVFPEQNLESVFARMRAERQRIARQYRAEGEQEAARVKAEADKQKEQILSEAYRVAETTKGQGEAEAARLYAAAHAADPQFYRLTRTLQAYERMFGADTTVVLSGDSELLRLMTQGREANR